MSRTLTHAVILFVCGSGIYIEAVGHRFHYDDFHSIVENPHIRTLANVGRFFLDPSQFSTHGHNPMYRPLLLASYAVNHAVDDLNPRGYHLFNVLLHGINGILVYALLRALTPTTVAFSAACLFAIHPINSEAANYVSSRSEMLMAGFFLASCIAWVRFGVTGRWLWYCLALGGAGLALASKSVAIVIPGAFALIDRVVFGMAWRCRVWLYLPAAAIGLLYLLVSRAIVGKALMAPVRSLDLQIWTQVKAWIYYILQLAMPVHLSVDHQFFAARTWIDPPNVPAFLFLVSIAWVVVQIRRAGLGWIAGWWSLILAPTALVPLIVLVNDHRLYLAAPAFFVLAAICLCRFARGTVATTLTVAYFLLLVVLSLERTAVWRDELSLWRDAAARGPLMVKSQLRYGDALAAAAKVSEPSVPTGLTAAAEQVYLRALEIRPQHPGVRNNLGLLYLNQGRLDAAEEHFAALLAVSPDVGPARLNLARLLMQQGRWNRAEEHYLAALEYGDTGGKAQGYLAHIAQVHRGDPQRALALYDEALAAAVAPDVDHLIGRGVALVSLERSREAEVAYLQAIRIDPGHVVAWYNLGNLHLRAGDTGAAAQAYRRVVRLAGDRELADAAHKKLDEIAR